MKKTIRNDGYLPEMDKPDARTFRTRVDYAARTYEFPAGEETLVEADVADYVSSIHAGQGLVISDHAPEGPAPKTAEEYEAEIAALKAKVSSEAPAPSPTGSIPEPTEPIAGTEGIRLARDAAAKKTAAATKKEK